MKVFIKSTFTLILLVSLLTGKSFAQSKKNLHLFKIYTLDRKISRGILDSVDNNGLYLVKRIGRPRTFISANQIKTIKLRRKSKASTGTTIGFLTGLAAGTGAAIALHNDDRVENAIRTVSAVLFTFATTAVAGAISSKPEEVIQISGRSEDYLQSLNHLKSFTPRGKH